MILKVSWMFKRNFSPNKWKNKQLVRFNLHRDLAEMIKCIRESLTSRIHCLKRILQVSIKFLLFILSRTSLTWPWKGLFDLIWNDPAVLDLLFFCLHRRSVKRKRRRRRKRRMLTKGRDITTRRYVYHKWKIKCNWEKGELVDWLNWF